MFCVPQRVVLSIMGFLAIVNAYTMRICLSVAITEMVKKTVSNSSIEAGDTCPVIDEGTSSGGATGDGTFEWDEQLQGLILSAFYWGYVITHLPGGYLAERFGGKYTLSLGILSTAIFTLLTPVVVEAGGSTWLIVLRVLQGLGEGTTFPALSALLAMWIPLNERSKLGSLVFGGGQVGYQRHSDNVPIDGGRSFVMSFADKISSHFYDNQGAPVGFRGDPHYEDCHSGEIHLIIYGHHKIIDYGGSLISELLFL